MMKDVPEAPGTHVMRTQVSVWGITNIVYGKYCLSWHLDRLRERPRKSPSSRRHIQVAHVPVLPAYISTSTSTSIATSPLNEP